VAFQGKVSITGINSGRSYMLSEGHHTVMAESFSAVPGQEKEESKQAPGRPAGQAPPGNPAEKPKSNRA
jgi:hypothetical protein